MPLGAITHVIPPVTLLVCDLGKDLADVPVKQQALIILIDMPAELARSLP